MKRVVCITIAILGCSGFFHPSLLYANSPAIRSELRSDLQWLSETYTYTDYMVAGTPSPANGHLERSPLTITGAYALFFTPILDDRQTPIALQRFYAHPSLIQLSFAWQPARESTFHQENPDSNYLSDTETDARAHNAGLQIECYFRRNTGLVLHISSTKNEDDARKSNTLNQQGTVETNEIRRYYGIGLSQYFFEHLNLRLVYTGFEVESLEAERSSSGGKDQVFIERDAETSGKIITFSGEYVFKKFAGVRGFYERRDQEARTKTSSSLYETLPATNASLTTYHDDDVATHTVGILLSLYPGQKTTLQLGAGYMMQKFKQTYRTIGREYDWKVMSFETGIVRYLTRYLGVRLRYEFTTRDGDVGTSNLESDEPGRTTYQITSHAHTAYLGIIGRF